MEANKIIITGGATRIGAAIAEKLSGPGKEIVIHFNKSRSKAEKLKKELSKNNTKVYLVKGDLSVEKDVNKILKFAKTIIADDGLTSDTFKKISNKYEININEINLLFPEGKNDFLKFILEQLNRDLEEYCKTIDLIRLPVHKRVRKILLSKIFIMNQEKKL